MKKRLIIASCVSLVFLLNVFSQSSDTLTFTKGRSMTSLFGTLTNQQVDFASDGTASTTGYTLGTKSGYFLKNNWILGVNFSLSRAEFDESSQSNQTENLLLGLWSRLYFAERQSTALYAEITPYVSSIYTQNIVRDNAGDMTTHEEVRGGGFGIEPGFGFVYIINRNVGFGLTLSYTIAQLQVDISDRLLDTTSPDTFKVNQLRFGFNFQVYLDQFFF